MTSSAVQAAQARCSELAKVGPQVGSRCEAAARKLAEVEADERRHAGLLEAARAEYASDPTDSNAAAIRKAHENHELAALRVDVPRAEHEAAQAEAKAWRGDVEQAAADAQRAVLGHRASLEEYNRRTAEPFKVLLAALAAIPAAAAAIDRAFDEANAAASEVGDAELSGFHRIAPLLRSAAAVHGAEGLVNGFNFYRAAGGCEHGLVAALPFPLLETIRRYARDRGTLHGAAASDLLDRVLACRTASEAGAAIKEAETLAVAATSQPEPDRSAWQAEQARLRKERGDDAAHNVAAPAEGRKATLVNSLDDVARIFGAETAT